VTLGVVSEFIRDNITFRFSDILLSSAREVWGEISECIVIVDAEIDNPSYSQVIDCRKIFRSTQKDAPNTSKEAVATHNQGKESFSSRFDLNSFIV
jgi:hypothetical protein